MLSGWRLQGFDWDDGNSAKIRKHGLTAAIVEAFFFGDPSVADDHRHSTQEQRFVAFGPGPDGRWMMVSFTIRRRIHLRLLRPISARYMHRREILRYEKNPSAQES